MKRVLEPYGLPRDLRRRDWRKCDLHIPVCIVRIILKYSGFSKFINDLSLTLVGRSPGGLGKGSRTRKRPLGMINGSAIANVATTGTITIPLMKKTGYRKEFMAAVEAVASTGGYSLRLLSWEQSDLSWRSSWGSATAR